jgi:DNA-binding LacI/PurR family transcriptional regulator
MSIIGYDDNEDICGRTRPRLTTIRQSKEEMGATAARMLIEKLGQHTPKRPEIRFLPVALIERESAAPCPGHARKRRMEMAAKGLATRHS